MARNDAKSEGIDFNPDGTIDLIIDGVVRHLRRPKLREFRHFSERLRELAKAAQLEAVTLQEALVVLKETDDDAEIERIQKELEEANRKRLEYTAPWLSDLVDQFSGNALPDDVEDWPSWLALDLTIPAKILGHWKVVPLAPGKAGTN